jgi:arylsulfatase A-like enzyme
MIRRIVLATALVLACNVPSISQTFPNVLLVIADDFGIDASPCYAVGKNKPNMPNLEKFCKGGAVFDNVWVNPVCTPTRASLLTGRYGFRTKVGSVGDVLDSDQITIFDALNKQGVYSSAVIGKWHVGAGNDTKHPASLGVPYYTGFLQGALRDFNSIPLVKDGAITNVTGYATTVFTDLAFSWVKQQTKPWFLWLAYNAPHAPFHLPPKNLISNQNLTGSATDIRSNPQAYYFAAAEALDAEMGRLLKSVDQNNTVIIFMGDNGTPAQVTQFTGNRARAKGSVYEGGVTVPLVISGAGQAATRASGLVNGVDITATIAAITGAKLENIDGQSLQPALQGKSPTRSFAYTEVFKSAMNNNANEQDVVVESKAIRDAQYKLIRFASGSKEELYDLKNDPFEAKNLLSSSSVVEFQALTKLRAELDKLKP